MATAHYQPMAYQPQYNTASNQCIDPADMENFVDFGRLTSPTPSSSISKGKMPAISVHSAMTSPSSTAIPLDADDQTPVAPAHDYGRFKQQTGLPTGSIASLRALQEDQYVFANFNSGIPDEFAFASFDGMGSQNGLGSMTSDVNMDASMPAFFYPSQESQNDDFIDPTTILKQEDSQTNVRYYPGMHQQAAQMRAQQAAAQRQQMLAQQKQREDSQQSRRKASPVDAHAEETIARVVNQIRQNSMMHASMSPDGMGMPTMIKKHRDDDDMDEDERLLNSEEGKKLSSKERRQLRNKVSARAFRSRRKEYIGQLEGEIAQKANEAADLKLQNRALMEENARFRALSEKLLAHAAFRPFLEELSRDSELASSFAAVVNNSTAASQAATTPQPQIKKDVSGYQDFNAGYQSQNVQHVGMTMIPEPQVDFSQLSWGMNQMGLQQQNGFQPQVYAVTSIPEEPVNVAALSGKYSEIEEDVIEETFESAKSDVPAEIEVPAKDMPAAVEEKVVESAVESVEFDSEDPSFTLFASSPVAASAQPTLNDAINLMSQLPTEKSSQYDIITESNTEMSTSFDKSCARLDAACKRMDAVFASFGL